MNREPNNEHRITDDELISAAVERAELGGETIDDAAARMIASQWHGGQVSELYSFASTGHVSEGVRDEARAAMREAAASATDDTEDQVAHLHALGKYLAATPDREPVDGWSQLWLEPREYEETGLDENDECIVCGEHFANPHAPGCDFEADNDVIFEEDEEPATVEQKPTLEDQIKAKFLGMNTLALISKTERAPDFGYDDEARELSRRLEEKGQTWRWSDSFTNPHIIVEDAGGEA